MADTPTPSRLRFGPFLADFRACELRKDGRKIRLQEKPLLLLEALTARPSEVVSREDLQKRLWPGDTFVDFETGLNGAVKKLREALADNPENPRYIETIPKRGYRFLAQVHSDGTNELVPREQPSPRTELTDTSLGRRTIASLVETVSEYRRAKRFWMIIAGVLAIAGLAVAFGHVNVAKIAALRDRWSVDSGPPTIRSLAVLPLQNLSNDPAQEYLSDGITDELITDLAQIGSLRVISRTSSMQYKQTKKSLPEIASELNVDGIIEGTVKRSGDRVRITAQLIHGPSDKHLWAKSYDRDMRDVLTFEQEVTADIARRVQMRAMTGRETAQLQPVDLEALEAYLQGNYHLNKADEGPRDEELRKAGEFFQQAINTAPNFASAYIGLANSHFNVWWGSGDDWSVMGRAAERAVALDPGSSNAWNALGNAKTVDWDWSGAEEQYRRAIALNPNSAEAHESLADILDTFGQLEDGWKEHNIAQQLDPNEDHLSEALRRRGQYDRAIDILKRVSDRRPNNAVVRWFLSENYARKGQYSDWVEELARCMSLFGLPKIADHLRRSFTVAGYSGASQTWARELELLAENRQAYFPGLLAEQYAALGNKDRAFYWLEQGCEHPHQAVSDPVLQFVKVDPGFTPLRSDARFNSLLSCMRLPP